MGHNQDVATKVYRIKVLAAGIICIMGKVPDQISNIVIDHNMADGLEMPLSTEGNTTICESQLIGNREKKMLTCFL